MQDRRLVASAVLRLPADDGHAECIGDQLGAHVFGNRPTHDQPRMK